MQRRGAARYCDRIAGADAFGQSRFKSLDQGPLREEIALKRRNDGLDIDAIDDLAAVAEETGRHASHSIAALSCSAFSQLWLVLLAYSKSADTGRPCSPSYLLCSPWFHR
jgi:hypothetical protein